MYIYIYIIHSIHKISWYIYITYIIYIPWNLLIISGSPSPSSKRPSPLPNLFEIPTSFNPKTLWWPSRFNIRVKRDCHTSAFEKSRPDFRTYDGRWEWQWLPGWVAKATKNGEKNWPGLVTSYDPWLMIIQAKKNIWKFPRGFPRKMIDKKKVAFLLLEVSVLVVYRRGYTLW